MVPTPRPVLYADGARTSISMAPLILNGLEIARGVSGFDGLATLFNVRLFGGFSLTCINA